MTLAASPRRWWRTKLLLGTIAVLVVAAYVAILIVRFTSEMVPVVVPPFLAVPGVLNIAHRGASGHTDGRSFDAYQRAVEMGADVLELDVRLTKDGIPIVVHDESLARTAGVPSDVSAITHASLVEAAGERAPATLDAVFRRFPHYKLNIELKQDQIRLATAVAELVDRYQRHDSVLVASFHTEPLRHFRKLTAGAVATSASGNEAIRFYLCYLMNVPCRPQYAALQIAYGFSLDLGKRKFIDFAHQHGLRVHYWTVNDERSIRRLIENGADGIITDYPDRVSQVLREAPQDNIK